MKVSMIAAVAKNNAIGKNNDLIWHLPDDMKYFMNTTLNHHVLMGRKNYLSIPQKFRPFKNRTNLVITRQDGYKADNCHVFNSIQAGIDFARENNEEELFIIGGGEIYKSALEMGVVDRMYITWINDDFEADTFYPTFDETQWKKTLLEKHPIDDKHRHSFDFYVYDKR